MKILSRIKKFFITPTNQYRVTERIGADSYMVRHGVIQNYAIEEKFILFKIFYVWIKRSTYFETISHALETINRLDNLNESR